MTLTSRFFRALDTESVLFRAIRVPNPVLTFFILAE